jgi:hypothetical protein
MFEHFFAHHQEVIGIFFASASSRPTQYAQNISTVVYKMPPDDEQISAPNM